MKRRVAVWAARHGERIDFVDPDWSSDPAEMWNPPLSPNGFVQARDLGERLRGEGLRYIVSSPFLRTLQTADCVAEALGLRIHVERGAGEMLSADWFPDGDPRTWSLDGLCKQFPRIDRGCRSAVDPEYPEDWSQCKVRAAATMRALVDRLGGDFLVVAHGATVSSMCWGLIDGFPSMQGGCCALVKLVSRPGGRWHVELDGDTSHLSYREPEYRLI